MSQKIAIISDIHGNLEAFKSVLDHILSQGLSNHQIYCLGDSVGYGPHPNEVLELLQTNQIVSILGNYDQSVAFKDKTEVQLIPKSPKNAMAWTQINTKDNTKAYLRNLKQNLSITIGTYTLLLTHGSPNSIKEYVYESDAELQESISHFLEEEILLMGHTHYPYIKKVNNKTFINVGSVGRPKDGNPSACYCMLELGKEVTAEFVRVAYNHEATAEAIKNSTLSDEYIDHVLSGSI